MSRDTRYTYTFPPGIPASFFHERIFPLIYTRTPLYPMPTWTSPPHPLLRNAFVGCRVGVIVLHDSFRDASAPVLRGIPGKRDYFSQFAKQMLPLCSPLPRQEFVFVSPLLASAAPFLSPSLTFSLSPHRALVSPCRPATGFFPPFSSFLFFPLLLFSPVHTSSYS